MLGTELSYSSSKLLSVYCIFFKNKYIFFILPAVKLTLLKICRKGGELEQIADNFEDNKVPLISPGVFSRLRLDVFYLDFGNYFCFVK